MPAIRGGGTSPYVRVSLYVLISGYTLSRYHLKLRHFSLWRRASRSDTSPKSTPGFCKAGSEAGPAVGCAEPRQPRPRPRVGELHRHQEHPRPQASLSGNLLSSQDPARSRAAGLMAKAWRLWPLCSRFRQRPAWPSVGHWRYVWDWLACHALYTHLGGNFEHPKYCCLPGLCYRGQGVCATG